MLGKKKCFWQLCDCPSSIPCKEHSGYSCSFLHRHYISDITQVNDHLTAKLELTIGAVEKDNQKIEKIRSELEAQKEKFQSDLENFKRKIFTANIFTRTSVFKEAQQAVEEYKQKVAEIQAKLDEIDLLVDKPDLAILDGLSNLLIPGGGYCECYDEKLRRLNDLSQKINNERAILSALSSRYSASRSAFLMTLVTISWPAFVLGIKVAAIILLGVGWVALLIPLISLILVLIALVAAAIMCSILAKKITQSQKRLLELILEHYRLQQIPVCAPTNGPSEEIKKEEH